METKGLRGRPQVTLQLLSSSLGGGVRSEIQATGCEGHIEAFAGVWDVILARASSGLPRREKVIFFPLFDASAFTI